MAAPSSSILARNAPGSPIQRLRLSARVLSGLIVDGEPGSGLVVPAPHRTGGVAHPEGARGDVTGDYGPGAHQRVLPAAYAPPHPPPDAADRPPPPPHRP